MALQLMFHHIIFLYFPKKTRPILSKTLKGHKSETVCPFKLKLFVEMHFDKIYLGSTREALGIDQSIAIDMLSMPALKYRWACHALPFYTLRAGHP
jgi:hypothetical protein